MHFTPLNVSPRSCRRPRGQRGMALVFVLIMISIVFVIAAVSSRIVTLGERAARNDRDRQTAFQAAEAALSDAEIDIMGPNTSITARVAMFGTLPADEGCSNAIPAPVGLVPAALETGAYKPIFQDDDRPTAATPILANSPTVKINSPCQRQGPCRSSCRATSSRSPPSTTVTVLLRRVGRSMLSS